MIQKVFIRNVSLRFYAKSKFCVCFEVHIPVDRDFNNSARLKNKFSRVARELNLALSTTLIVRRGQFASMSTL